MELRLVRSRTAELVAEVVNSRYGRKFLESFGWHAGMPIVMARSTESLDDVMALVSIHGTPVFVVVYRQQPERLCLICITRGTDALEIVEASNPAETIGDLYDRSMLSVLETFRVRFWRFSAVAHAVPAVLASTVEGDWNTSSALGPTMYA